MKKIIGIFCAITASCLFIYILLGMAMLVPMNSVSIMGHSLARFLAQIAVLFYLISAWAFWEI